MTRRTAVTLLLSSLAASAFVAPKAQRVVPTRGFSLPDWLAPSPRVPATATLDRLRAAGFETIRLPIDPAIVTADFAPVVASALSLVVASGFNAILDLHPTSDVDADRIVAAWTVLADVLAGTPADRVYAELLKEPPLAAKQWSSLAARLAAKIRAACPLHTLIWGPARVQGIWELADQRPPPDPNLIAAVHYYTPMGFTHQCDTWDDSPLARLRNLPFPTTRRSPEVTTLAATLNPSDRDFLDGEFKGAWSVGQIADDFATLGQWSKRHHIPVMLGEFGVLNFCVDPVSRANWVRAVREAAEANGAGWTYWEADQGFGFIADRTSTEGFDASMIEALIG